MKILLTIASVIISCSAGHAQKSISGSLKNCTKDYPVAQHLIRLEKNNAEIDSVFTDAKGHFYFGDLSDGEYNICYKSTYNLDIVFSQNIEREDIKKIQLCFDSLNIDLDTISPPIERLTVDDIIEINYNSSGCFHNVTEKLIIKKVDVDLFNFKAYENEELIKDTLVNDIDDPLRDFILWGALITYTGSHGCTTMDTYSVFINGDLVRPKFIGYEMIEKKDILKLEYPFSFLDGTCDWNGIEKLKKCIK